MRLNRILFGALGLLAVIGCKTSEPTQSTATSQPSQTAVSPQPTTNRQSPAAPAAKKPALDACALLSSNEIQFVQGEPVKETKSSGKSDRGVNTSQCFFTLPTFTNSISLSVTQRGNGPDARDPKEFWEDTFGEGHRGGEKREKDDRDREEEREESAASVRVNGIGEEAFWTGSRVGGALYVLKGNVYFRISVGGADSQTSRIKKSKTLAQKVLVRL